MSQGEGVCVCQKEVSFEGAQMCDAIVNVSFKGLCRTVWQQVCVGVRGEHVRWQRHTNAFPRTL